MSNVNVGSGYQMTVKSIFDLRGIPKQIGKLTEDIRILAKDLMEVEFNHCTRVVNKLAI